MKVLADIQDDDAVTRKALEDGLREAVGALYNCRHSEQPLARRLDALLKDATGETYGEFISRQFYAALSAKSPR